MNLKNALRSISRKVLVIISAVVIVTIIIFFIWRNYKYRIVNRELAKTVANQTDSLYKIKYDSLHFDELTGEAYLKNVHIVPDTSIIKNTKLEDLPYILLDITIASVRVSGVKTDKALLGQRMIGDSVVIDHPDVIVYFVKPLQKQTKIDAEAKSVYDEILGNLNRIQVGHVFINNVHIQGIGFFAKEKEFDLINGNIELMDVLVDSAHNLDTSRTLFCKQSALKIGSFVSYNNNRPEFRVSDISYSGKGKFLSFADISVNRFESENSDSSRLLHATGLNLIGLNTNEIVKNKNIIVDTINCTHITVFEPPVQNAKNTKESKPKPTDSTGFMHVYSIDMKHLGFPKVEFIPAVKSNYTLGNIAIKINEVRADEIIQVKNHPLEHSKEVEINCDHISMNSKDGMYEYSFQHTAINSMQKQLKIGSFTIRPFLSEVAFANKAHFQNDRYDVSLKGIVLKNIDMKNILDKKIFASDLTIDNTSAKIYHDLQKPLKKVSKVGNYPSQMLMKLDIPMDISHVVLSNAFIQYKEKETVSDSVGVVTFTGSTINIFNVTNLDESIKRNNFLTAVINTRLLGTIPIKASFKFSLNGPGGNFSVNGSVPGFDARLLNKVAVPMALMRINTGTINAVDFNFAGNDTTAKGDFVMKYEELKVDVLKRDKDSKEVKKKGIKSLLANIIVKNNNPGNGDLRKEEPRSDRNIYKSFFNLVWKTIFTGMKKTVGLP
ncbi:MAG: hypothetical protein ABI472_12720 [Ginsengibacter sp.]